ncbi:von Willebrand factor type A domain protein [gut metagenome]|uniref:von Willebrand factor type A domain protein n=1 Tax=gut metagenome TaxID=749906 RepID=J9G9B5_9ZZZZ
MTFANVEYLLLLLLLIPFIVWHFLLKRRQEPSVKMATTVAYQHLPLTPRIALIHLPFVLRMLTFILVVLVMARPQTAEALHEDEVEGIDIMMAMDVSTSMLTPDIKPNRIEAAKEVAYEFINNRPYDNIGLTLFGGEAFMQCPLTTDHKALLSMFGQVSCDLQARGILSPGTAIGMGLSNAVSHLEKSGAKSKVVILLTDGVDNTGDISPQMAADLAKQCGVRVYTISLGSEGSSRQAVQQLPNGELYEADVTNTSDPEVLRKIAETTGGKFYLATSKGKLRDIYSDIDAMEKSKLKVLNYSKKYEAYQFFALAALVVFLLEVVLRLTWFRRMP